MSATERAGMPPLAAWTPPPGVPGPLNPSTGHTGPRMGGGLAPPAEDVAAVEHLDLSPPGCSWLVGPTRDLCGSTPVTHRLVVRCGCVTLLCPPHLDELVDFLAEHVGWTLFCAQCGTTGLDFGDFRVVPL